MTPAERAAAIAELTAFGVAASIFDGCDNPDAEMKWSLEFHRASSSSTSLSLRDGRTARTDSNTSKGKNMDLENLLRRADAVGLSRAELAGKSIVYIETRIELREKDKGARNDSRVDGPHSRDDADPELRELIRTFDTAVDYLENYQAADPWLNGERSAHNAAMKATGGASSSRRSDSFTRDTRFDHVSHDGVDGELAALIKHFDGAEKYLENYQAAEPWMNGEKAAHEAAMRFDDGTAADTPAARARTAADPDLLEYLREQSERTGLDKVFSLEDLIAMNEQTREQLFKKLPNVMGGSQ